MGTSANDHDQPNREPAVPRSALEQMPRAELFALARRRGVPNTMVMTRDELLEAINRGQAESVQANGTPAPAEMAARAGVRAEESPAPPPPPEAAAAPADLRGRASRAASHPASFATSLPAPPPPSLPPASPTAPPGPPRPAAAAPVRAQERKPSVSVSGVAAAAVATALFVWRRRR